MINLNDDMTVESGLISIIIPVYNNRSILQVAISSCLSQTYNEIEIVVIDDGSTDGLNREKVLSMGEKISYLAIPNQGPGIARNAGLDIAHGEYVFFLDSDDVIHEDSLQSLVARIDNYDFVVGKCERVFLDKNNNVSKKEIWKNNVYGHPPDKRTLITDTIATNKLYRTAFLSSANLRFPEGEHEDILFVCKLYNSSDNFAVLDKVVYTWNIRRSLTSRSSPLTIDTLITRVQVLQSCIDILSDESLKESVVENAIKHDLKRYVNICKYYSPSEMDRLYDIYLAFVNDYSSHLHSQRFVENRAILLSIDSREKTKSNFLSISKRHHSQTHQLVRRIFRNFKGLLK